MATGDSTARASRAADFATDFGAATLTISAGATTLAEHTLAGFNTAVPGVLTALAIADDTILANGTADTVTLSDTAGSYDLVIGADITLSTTNYILGETSSVTSLVITFPAS